jgi:hypothetical protein
MRVYRHFLTLIFIAGLVCPRLQCQPGPLTVERQGKLLRVAAPHLHFLEGKPLEQLHNGAVVTYVFSLALTSERGASIRVEERFAVSYDLWEERYSVVRAGPAGRTGSHLTKAAAEAWCLENLQIPVPELQAGKSFVIKLVCLEAPDEAENSELPSLTLAGLIDVFSRRGREAPLRWEAVSGPLHFADVKDRKNAKSRPLTGKS